MAGLSILAATLALGPLSAQTATWVPVQGNVRLANGTPVCALVLANGQYMFSCDGTGAFNLNVPLDDQGQVTLFAFADGFAPYRVTAAPPGLPSVLRTLTAAPGSPSIGTTREVACAANNWVRLSGDVESFGGEPLCAMVLANGQHMFSCGESLGRYDLTVPADENGNITLFAFADGFQPYTETFVAPDCVSYVYDGAYRGEATPTTPTDTDGDPCGGASIEFTIYGNRLQGSATSTWGTVFSLSGEVGADGALTFGLAVARDNVADFGGLVGGQSASGTWSDYWGCRGTWSASKR